MMGDPFLDLIEQKMRNSLSLEQVSRPGSKSNLPFTVLNTEGSSPVLHLFEIPPSKNIFEICPSEKPRFGFVTMSGCISVYDTMFRRVTWKKQTSLSKVSWGILSWQLNPNPSIIIHSRQSGFQLVKPPQEDSTGPEGSSQNELLSTETHVGFCKPYLCSNQDVIVPLGEDKIGIYIQKEESIRACYKFQSALMAIKEIYSNETSKYIMCSTEDGYVHVLNAFWDAANGAFKVELVAQLLLPNYNNVEQQPTGLCIEGNDELFVIGSNLKYMFLVKWNSEVGSSLQPFAKKILPTDGVSCMAMREGKRTLAAGCFDGTVRIFGFPEMNQIATINYYKSQINCLLFINEKVSKDGRWFLLCGANEAGLSVWNIPACKVDS